MPVLDPSVVLAEENFDVIILASVPGYDALLTMCKEFGIESDRIVDKYVLFPLESRRIFLQNLAVLIEARSLTGSVAEAGVFEGDFAKYINRYFPERALYLFDTFDGFALQDVEMEQSGALSEAKVGDYRGTSARNVMKKMPYPERVQICPGYFPDSAMDIEDEFCFANLDLDLYLPTKRGLDYFSSRMVSGGVLLVHDYFADNFRGPRKAVDEFLSLHENYLGMPIGDGLSLLIAGF